MQGFILNITKATREDLILKILTPKNVVTAYRFYGARHSILFLGRKIDFELQDDSIYMPRLRSIMHLLRPYEKLIHKVQIWQDFIRLLNKHLSEVDSLSSFYYDLLEEGIEHLHLTDEIRLILKLYLKLLEFEGRIFVNKTCFICDRALGGEVVVARGFLASCTSCLHNQLIMPRDLFMELLRIKSSINLDSTTTFGLYRVLMQGL